MRFALAGALLLAFCGGDGRGGNPTVSPASRRLRPSVVAPLTLIRVEQSVEPLMVRGTYHDGPQARVDATWASTDTAVLTVDENGVVTGAGVGVAKVIATFGPLTAEVLFGVTPTG